MGKTMMSAMMGKRRLTVKTRMFKTSMTKMVRIRPLSFSFLHHTTLISWTSLPLSALIFLILLTPSFLLFSPPFHPPYCCLLGRPSSSRRYSLIFGLPWILAYFPRILCQVKNLRSKCFSRLYWSVPYSSLASHGRKRTEKKLRCGW